MNLAETLEFHVVRLTDQADRKSVSFVQPKTAKIFYLGETRCRIKKIVTKVEFNGDIYDYHYDYKDKNGNLVIVMIGGSRVDYNEALSLHTNFTV